VHSTTGAQSTDRVRVLCQWMERRSVDRASAGALKSSQRLLMAFGSRKVAWRKSPFIRAIQSTLIPFGHAS
jgi:hypothetical protein